LPRIFIRSDAWKEGATTEKATRKPSRIVAALPANSAEPGAVFARLTGCGDDPARFPGCFLRGRPFFPASDLIKILGISGVAIGFAFQNILQNFLAGLLLLWAEPFRIGDEIKLDNYEGSVEEIQTRATFIKTYDGRRVVIPNADLFTAPGSRSIQRSIFADGNTI